MAAMSANNPLRKSLHESLRSAIEGECFNRCLLQKTIKALSAGLIQLQTEHDLGQGSETHIKVCCDPWILAKLENTG